MSAHPELLWKYHLQDAAKLDLIDGQKVKVASRRGEIEANVKVSDKATSGTVFLPFHFATAAANRLTNSALDPVSKIPEFKVCAVKVSKT
jgi:formate dehydrogenase major subunit